MRNFVPESCTSPSQAAAVVTNTVYDYGRTVSGPPAANGIYESCRQLIKDKTHAPASEHIGRIDWCLIHRQTLSQPLGGSITLLEGQPLGEQCPGFVRKLIECRSSAPRQSPYFLQHPADVTRPKVWPNHSRCGQDLCGF